METLISIEDFKEVVIFHTLDVEIPEWANYIAVDILGRIAVYDLKPSIQGRVHQPAESTRGRFLYQHRDTLMNTINGGYTSVNIPEHLTWRDCIWEI